MRSRPASDVAPGQAGSPTSETSFDIERARRKLDAFLVDNDELEELSARLDRFNLFRVLRIEKAEIRHSNMLCWLLDPSESHGLGDSFLRRFLSRLLLDNDEVDIALTPAQVELMPLSDVEIRREWQNIDVLVRSASQKWTLLLENKIEAGEAPGQLRRYAETLRQQFPESSVIPVFLTLRGEAPSEAGREAGFVPVAYEEISGLLERLSIQRAKQIPEDARVLINHYLDILRRLTMQDAELVDLCKRIYRRHREAVELILEYGQSSQVLDACERFTRSLPDLEYVTRSPNRLWFLPKAVAEPQVDALLGMDFLPRRFPVFWWFLYDRAVARLQVTMEVGPFTQPALRIRLMEALREAGFKFWEKGAFREQSKYTRIVTAHERLRRTDEGEPDESEEYVTEVAEKLWRKAWAEGEKVIAVLQAFDWGRE